MKDTKVTITFTVGLHHAALLMAAYDIFSQPYSDAHLHGVAPQTLDNYPTLMSELRDLGRKLIDPAEDYSERVADDIKRILG